MFGLDLNRKKQQKQHFNSVMWKKFATKKIEKKKFKCYF
jgi:hypothetical protein